MIFSHDRREDYLRLRHQMMDLTGVPSGSRYHHRVVHHRGGASVPLVDR